LFPLAGRQEGGVEKRRFFFFFQVVFGVESALSAVHFPLGHWIVDFSYKFFFQSICERILLVFMCFGGGGEVSQAMQKIVTKKSTWMQHIL